MKLSTETKTGLPMAPTAPILGDDRMYGMQKFLTFVFLLMLVSNTVFNKPVLAITLMIYFPFAISHLFDNIRQTGLLMLKPAAMGLFWTLFVLSYTWSVVPKVSLQWIVLHLAFLLLVWLVTLRHQKEGFTKPLKIASMWLICLVVLYCVVFFRNSFTLGHLNAFYHQKNNLAAMMALCALALMYAPQRKHLHLLFCAVAAAITVASKSKTCIALIIICAAALPVADWWVRNNYIANSNELPKKNVLRPLFYRTAIVFLISLVLFRNQLLDLLWASFSKNMLTGRGALWLMVIQHVRGNSLLGIGPGTFWDAEGASEIARTVMYLADPVWVQNLVSADGSYIDLISSVGVLGLALFLWTVVEFYRRLFKHWQQPDARTMFVLATYVLLHAITETTLLAPINVLWFVYLLCYFRAMYYDHLRIGDWNPVNPDRAK